MVNISNAISHIIMSLGLYQVNLPFKEPTENVIHNVLKTITIPMYSQFQPWQREETVDLATLHQINKIQSIYILPDKLTTPPIISVVDVHLPIEVSRGMYGDISTPFGVSPTIQGVLTHQAYSMVIGEARAEPTFEYLGENRIRLYGYPKSWVTIKVSAQHTENGESIPETCYDSFMQLAMLDVRMFMYNNLKMYDNIATAFGNITLKIEDHQVAEADRAALLESWRDTWHLDMDLWQYM